MRVHRLAAAGGLLLLLMPHVARSATHAGGIALKMLSDEYWEYHLRTNPTTATQLGDHRYDEKLDDNSPAAYDVDEKAMRAMLASAKMIDTTGMSGADRLTRSALIVELEGHIAGLECRTWTWDVDPLGGPQVWLLNVPEYTSFKHPDDAAHYVIRCRAMGPYIDQHIANLRMGLAEGKTANADAVRKSLATVDQLVALPAAKWGLVAPADDKHPDWPAARRAQFKTEIVAVVNDVVKPAMQRYGAFLRDELTPKARPQDQAGIGAVPGGKDCYARMIKIHTSIDATPEELHEIGLQQVAKFRHDLAELGQKVFGTSDIAEIQKRLRTDPKMHFRTAAEVEAKAREALARAQQAAPRFFRTLPRTPCEVKVIDPIEAPNTTIAYYRQPAMDGSRPGRYMINTYQPTTRPTYEAEALAFHEAVPGHHLQIAIAQELKDLPEFRKHEGSTAFVEGWALYTERLADEMGLYSSDVDRMGMLSYDAWRACRLVVDTGMHAMGWSRKQAIDYMVENSLLAENNIENEVDRYLVWPGQALAYKVGQLEILKLREEAKQKLGDRFDIRDFHDVVLRDGAVTMPVLREQVEAWIERTAAARP